MFILIPRTGEILTKGSSGFATRSAFRKRAEPSRYVAINRMNQKLITIACYRDLPQAGLDKSILEDQGVSCFLDNEFTVGVNWLYSTALGGVKLKVLESDVVRAGEILRSYHMEVPQENIGDVGRGSEPTYPNCGSSEIEIKNYTRKFAAISLLLSLPLFCFLKRYL